MLEGFRREVANLPFVAVRDDGSLDYWSVAPSGSPEADFDRGRDYAANWLHFCRQADGAGLGAHILEAWIDQLAVSPLDEVQRGWGVEVLGALHRAPAGATVNLAIAESAPVRASHLLHLPFMSARQDGSVDGWAVRSCGSGPDDNAKGRCYAGVLAHYYRDTADATPFRLVWQSMADDLDRFEQTRQVWVGFATELNEIMLASDPDASRHQRHTASRLAHKRAELPRR